MVWWKVVSARSLVAALLLGSVCATAGVGFAQSSSDRVQGSQSIFSVGTEDRSYFEFQQSGFVEESEFACAAGVDCVASRFPRRLYRHNRTEYARTHDDEGVESVVIRFELAQDVPTAILRLARSGTETTVVTLDGSRRYTVTARMLGSGDGTLFGAYDLRLGELSSGNHSLLLTVADDGQGNGSYSWDAIELFGR